MLQISSLSIAIVDDQKNQKTIIRDCSMELTSGTVHALLGPNGSGKSSLLYALMGHHDYQLISGSCIFEGEDLNALPTHIRSKRGIFLAMQYPESIPGLKLFTFLKEVYGIHHAPLAAGPFREMIIPLLQQVGLSEELLYRQVNDGFSGGEKKRFELLQLLLLKPKICLLDEIDSGLDVDGLLLLSNILSQYRKDHRDAIIVLVTHYRRILDYLDPDMVHIMLQGRLVFSGNKEIAHTIDQIGFEEYAKRFE